LSLSLSSFCVSSNGMPPWYLVVRVSGDGGRRAASSGVRRRPHLLHDEKRGAEGLAEGANLGRRYLHVGSAGESPHNFPRVGHEVGDDDGVPRCFVNPEVVEGGVILNCCGHDVVWPEEVYFL
jgi:hypothetical protein